MPSRWDKTRAVGLCLIMISVVAAACAPPPPPAPTPEPSPPPATPAPPSATPEPSLRLVRGVTFASRPLTIAGEPWMPFDEARGQGLAVGGGLAQSQTDVVPTPPVDDDTRAMLNAALWSTAGNLALSQVLPDGEYQVALTVMENHESQYRAFDIVVEGRVVERGAGRLDLGRWATYGPYPAAVADGRLDIELVRVRGDPHLMGLAIYGSGALASLPTVPPPTATAPPVARAATPPPPTSTPIPASALAGGEDLPATRVAGLTGAGLQVVSSELTPAVLAITDRPEVTLFAGLDTWGLGAPSHVAFAAPGGIRTLRRAPDQRIAVGGGDLAEPWLVVWFRGAAGWERWDSPWLVVLQRRPERVALGPGGLTVRSAATTGHVALMPLYGLAKPDTAGWADLPGEVAARARFWARVMRAYPVATEETFRVDPQAGAVVVRNQFRWLVTHDDWRTPALRFAPLPPTLGLALWTGRMPAEVSGPVEDPSLVTSFGPYLGVRDTDSYEVRFNVLRYIVETEEPQAPDLSDPVVAAAHARMQQALREAFGDPDGLFRQDFGDPPNFALPPPQGGDGGNTCWALMSVPYSMQGLSYAPPELRAEASKRLRRYFADWVLQPERFTPFRGKLLLHGPGIGSWGGYDDAGKFASNTLVAIWAYGRATGDWALIRERWDLITQLFVTPREMSWRMAGRQAIAELGDEAAPALAMARLAYFVGDRDTYGFASYVFAQQLVHHVVKAAGAPYFLQHQPLNNPTPMPANVYLTNLWGDTAGWQIDGPTWPEGAGERQYTNRWMRFGDLDVARFHRDYLGDLHRPELDAMVGTPQWHLREPIDDPHGTPSLVRLRSLLLNEPPEALGRLSPVDAPTHTRSGTIAYTLAFIRAGAPPRFVELIPADDAATGWAPGLEREVDTSEAALTVAVTDQGGPTLSWWGWAAPRGWDRWPFGQIRTDLAGKAGGASRVSWNTQVLTVGE